MYGLPTLELPTLELPTLDELVIRTAMGLPDPEPVKTPKASTAASRGAADGDDDTGQMRSAMGLKPKK